jgi:iron complex outermembrane receptor protein
MSQSDSHATLNLPLAVSPFTESVTVNAQSSLITETPTGQTQTSVSRQDFRNTPATTIGEVLALTPGVTVIAGNGARDVVISVRGSNERQTYGVRNIQVFEDGFPVTQPDGLARTDLTDPHAYSSIDVVQGPSSALYGNYATDGAINFHTRTGSELQGLEVGADFGSFGYFNDYLTYGAGGERYQVSAFLSNVRATQATANNSFNTITANILATFVATTRDRFTIKFIDNDLDTNLSIRLSRLQYQ